jgi:hypothetical protein
VGLQQLALLTLVAVLRLGEIAQFGVGAAAGEQRPLVGAEAEPLADDRRLVGVDDPPVARPELDADDRRAQQPPLHEVVQPRERPGITGQDAVAQARGLDERALQDDAIACVALGLPHGHRPQREEPADDHDRDRRQRSEHEAGHRGGGAGGRAGGGGPGSASVGDEHRRTWCRSAAGRGARWDLCPMESATGRPAQ